MIYKSILSFSLLLMSCIHLWAGPELEFVENRNQWNDKVHFAADIHGGRVFFEQDRFTYLLRETPPHCQHHSQNHQHDEPLKAHAYQMIFENAQEVRPAQGKDRVPTYRNYFLGNDPQKWASNVPSYRTIIYQELYDCVDLHVYSKGNALKYDLFLKKGGNHKQIKIRYEGADQVYLKDEVLHITTSIGEMLELQPYAYQIIDGKEIEVQCDYTYKGESLSFKIGKYNKDYDLIIDPTVIFASYSGSTADNWGSTATYDSAGNAYGGGMVFAAGYPTTTGSLYANFGGGDTDMGITKFSADGSLALFTTYLGGNDSEIPHSLVVDAADNLIVMGTTGSADYPISIDAYDSSYGDGSSATINNIQYTSGSDIVLSKISADGASLIGSTFFGGSANDGLNSTSPFLNYNYGDQARGEVIVDLSGDIIIASCTESDDVPTTAGVIQPSHGGAQDGIVAKFNADLSSLIWSSYFGGSGDDAAYSIKENEANGAVYFAGGTAADVPVSGGLITAAPGGPSDGFLVRIDANCTSATSTYVGTSSYDQVYFVETNVDGDVYAYGQTAGNYPVEGTVWSEANQKQFIHSFSADLSSTNFSTTFGANGDINISPTAFLVDRCDRIYAAGWGGGLNPGLYSGTVSGMTTTSDAFQANTIDASDLYFLVLDQDAEDLLYATYFGGSGQGEHVDGGTSRFDKSGVIYQAICACSGPFGDTPTTGGSVSPANGSSNCNLHVLKLDLEQSIPTAQALANPTTAGCADPVFTVQFENQSEGATDYVWDFGNGQVFEGQDPPPTIYTDAGVYDVQLIAFDSLQCVTTDTVYTQIIVGNPEVFTASFDYTLPDGCESMSVLFTNTSPLPNDPATDYEYLWDFGDGFQSAAYEPDHTYFINGDYNVSLTVTSLTDTLCNSFASASGSFTLAAGYDITASLDELGAGCIPYNLSTTADPTAPTVTWLLDGQPIASGPDLNYDLNTEGDHLLELILNDPASCNQADTASVTVTGYGFPVAGFTSDLPVQELGLPISFSNTSTDGSTVSYTFGDGNTSTEDNPIHTYASIGDYEVCITAINPLGGCEDIFCESVTVDETWKIELPNAFSPNGDGVNDVLYLRGFGMQDIELQLFDRWGQLVFTTTSFEEGWDGTFKDKFQEIEVVVYKLTAKTLGGESIQRSGNVTVLR